MVDNRFKTAGLSKTRNKPICQPEYHYKKKLCAKVFKPISVVNPGVTLRGTGREKWLEAVCKQDSTCRP